MTSRARLVCWSLGLAVTAAELPAQPIKQERRTVALHAELLHELWSASRGASTALTADIDRALLSDQAGNPFAPLGRALALSAGGVCDADYLARLLVHVNALPEIVDPDVPEDGDAKTPYRLHVTLHTPFTLAESRPLRFALAVVDAAGEQVWSGAIDVATAQGLAQFEHSLAIPVHELADGAYEVRARASLGDAAPRAHDPVARARVRVQRGFAKRAVQMAERIEPQIVKLDRGARAAARGALIPVQRVYTGEAHDGVADVGADVDHAARVVANLEAGRPLLTGARGYVSLGIELGADGPPLAQVRMRVPTAAGAAAASRPLVLFLCAAPTWDGAWRRPSFAHQRPPGHLARILAEAGFDRDGEFVVAVVAGDADAVDPLAVIERSIAAVAELAAVDRGRIVLVAEREAATAAFGLARRWAEKSPLRAIVAVAGGALGREEVAVLAHTRALFVPGVGLAATENITRTLRFAQDAGFGARAREATSARAWPLALPAALAEIEAFCRSAARD